MVTSSLSRLGNRLLGSVRDDVAGFLGSVIPGDFVQLPAGLYTYRFNPSGGSIRIHLRIEDNGHGTLFVDVSDVIHLNPTAASMAKLALDEVPMNRARASLLRGIQDRDRARFQSELEQIYEMIDHFRYPENGCVTCSVGFLDRSPLFSTQASAPSKADLALTYGCNNHCGHCYNEPQRFDMPSLTREKWFQVLDRLALVGVPHVIFTGGEATLHPDLPELIHYANSLGLITGLNSNGRRIAHLPFMNRLSTSGLDHVQITLGSCRPEVHDFVMAATSFSQTVAGITNAVNSNVHCITNTTLMKCNMDHVEETIDFLYGLGIRTFAMNGMIYSGGGFQDPNTIPENELQPLLIRVRDHAAEMGMRFLWYTPTEYCRMSPVELEIGAKRCNAGEYSICVEPNGDVLPCQSYYVSAGNILLDEWENIWSGELFRSFRNRGIDPQWAGLPEKCWDCPDLPLCGGGCRIEREARNGRRITEFDGPGCSGCSTGAGFRSQDIDENTTHGFIPFPGTTSANSRAGSKATIQIPLKMGSNGGYLIDSYTIDASTILSNGTSKSEQD